MGKEWLFWYCISRVGGIDGVGRNDGALIGGREEGYLLAQLLYLGGKLKKQFLLRGAMGGVCGGVCGGVGDRDRLCLVV